MERRHHDWLDYIRFPIHDKNAPHDALLRNPTSRTQHERFPFMRTAVQRMLRWMENNWRARKAAQIQSYGNINDTKNCYKALIGVFGPSSFSLYSIRSRNSEFYASIESMHCQLG